MGSHLAVSRPSLTLIGAPVAQRKSACLLNGRSLVRAQPGVHRSIRAGGLPERFIGPISKMGVRASTTDRGFESRAPHLNSQSTLMGREQVNAPSKNTLAGQSDGGSNMMDTRQQTTSTLMNELDRLRTEKIEYERKAARISQTIDAYEHVIADLTGAPLPGPSMPTESLPVEVAHVRREDQQILPLPANTGEWRKKLRGLTHIEALIKIAKENDGVVRVADAKRILVDANLTTAKARNVSSHIYHTLARSERFERTDPGVFRLADPVMGTPASAPHPPGRDFITIEEDSTA